MDWDTWNRLYKRLCATYGKAINGEQAAAYFEALSQFSAAIVEKAIAKTIRDHKTWPSVAELCERARGVIAATPYDRSQCELCHGDGWVEAENETHFHLDYRWFVRRCPQCYHVQAAA